jgi:hypothetical protein
MQGINSKSQIIMKRHATLKRLVSIFTGSAILGVVSLAARPGAFPHKHGTDILHLYSTTIMTNEGVVTNACGQVMVAQNEQGKANNQRMDISLRGLETNTTYQLLAVVGSDTNFITVTNLDTDSRGRASLSYVSHANGHGNGLGHGRNPLPDVLNPVSEIHEAGIFDGSTQAVLIADLTAPHRLQYLIQRDLSDTNGVDAELRIKATARCTQFRLTASGLNPTNDYFLVFNGDIVQTNTTDKKGRLAIVSLMDPPMDILKVQTVALWDDASNVVVSTELP